MKKLFSCFYLTTLLFILVGCCETPDLAFVGPPSKAWDISNTGNKIIKISIKNLGRANAGNFLIYFDAETGVGTNQIMAQVVKPVSGLPAGASTIPALSANFLTEASYANGNPTALSNVKQVRITIDAKGSVTECNEGDNVVVIPVP